MSVKDKLFLTVVFVVAILGYANWVAHSCPAAHLDVPQVSTSPNKNVERDGLGTGERRMTDDERPDMAEPAVRSLEEARQVDSQLRAFRYILLRAQM